MSPASHPSAGSAGQAARLIDGAAALENMGRHGAFRKRGFFIGSGVVEAGCKTVIGARCKQSGMFWPEPGAENVLALRCTHSRRRRVDFWKHRLNQHAKRNDALGLSA